MSTRKLLDPPLINVRFESGAEPPYGPDATDDLAQRGGEVDWERLNTAFPGLKVLPLFSNANKALVERIVARAKSLSPRYQPPPFLASFRIELPPTRLWHTPLAD